MHGIACTILIAECRKYFTCQNINPALPSLIVVIRWHKCYYTVVGTMHNAGVQYVVRLLTDQMPPQYVQISQHCSQY